MKNGEAVKAFEAAFAEYVGAKYAIALCNGTATLHTALVALGVKPGDRVAVPPLTMAATSIAVLLAGAVPVFCDVSRDTWLMEWALGVQRNSGICVSLYGLHAPPDGGFDIDDAAQTLRPHNPANAFTSYSFQASKILALGEGGMLVTNDEALAQRAREFSSLGYRMRADQPRIDPAAIKSPTFDRHHSLGWNYRMNDITAAKGLAHIARQDESQIHPGRLLAERRQCAHLYREAIHDCDWFTPQYVPEGWTHDYWTYAVATDTPARCLAMLDAVEKHGGERPYPAWRLTYHEPAFLHLGWPPEDIDKLRTTDARTGLCPIAESLQPRLAQFQTNKLVSARRNAEALRRAIAELDGTP